MSRLPHDACIALGSNLGSPRKQIETALARLAEQETIEVLEVSTLVETEPLGPAQPRFLNGAARLRTSLLPRELLDVLLSVEREAGRVRTQGERWGPRTLDLDLLLYDDVALETPELTLPHPEMARRLFVLEPLCEIAPDRVHPVLLLTVRELRDGLKRAVS